MAAPRHPPAFGSISFQSAQPGVGVSSAGSDAGRCSSPWPLQDHSSPPGTSPPAGASSSSGLFFRQFFPLREGMLRGKAEPRRDELLPPPARARIPLQGGPEGCGFLRGALNKQPFLSLLCGVNCGPGEAEGAQHPSDLFSTRCPAEAVTAL